MAVYLIAQVTIHDRAEYDRYQAGLLDVFARHEGELLAVSDGATVLEGEWPCTRTVLMRFPSEAAARRWFESPDYQRISEHRHRGATTNVVMIQALPGG